jgi:hypothetical protein
MDDPLPRLLSFGPDVFDLTKENYNSCGWRGVLCSTSGALIYIHDSNLLSIQAAVIFPSLIVQNSIFLYPPCFASHFRHHMT